MTTALKIVTVLALLFVLTACPQSTLTTIGKSLNDYAVALNGVQNVILQANAAGNMSNEEALPIVNLLFKLNEAGKQASLLTRNLNSLPPSTANQLTAVLTPIVQALQLAVSSGLTGIKNPTIRQNIITGLSTAQLALTTITALLPKAPPVATGRTTLVLGEVALTPLAGGY